MLAHPGRSSRMRLAPLIVVAALASAGCGGTDDAGPATTDPSIVATGPEIDATSPATDPPSGTDSTSPVDAGRVVALGEEFVLADLLALGVRPVASSATVPEVGFVGVDEFDTDGIEVVSATDLNIEQLAALRPEVIVTTQFIAAEAGADRLAALADVVVLPDDATAEGRLRLLAERFGATDRADDLVAELDAARGDLERLVAGRTEPCIVTLATVYPGPSVAAWVDGSTAIPAAVVDAGCELVPGPDTGSPDRNGRLFLSLEQLSVLDGPTMILLQSDLVEGESDAIATLEDNPLWRQVPAVTAGSVVELDRLGYPGVPGQIRLVSDLAEILPDAG
jgi:iron complex transport system substrate-binding protein